MNEKKQDGAIQESRGRWERGMVVLPCAFGRRPCDEWGTVDGVIRQRGVAARSPESEWNREKSPLCPWHGGVLFSYDRYIGIYREL